MTDVAAACAWYFGVDPAEPATTRNRVAARRCAYTACLELGFTKAEISRHFARHRTTVIHALNHGKTVDPDDLAAVLANARARALADTRDDVFS